MAVIQSDVIAQARAITGNVVGAAVGEMSVPDEAILLAITSASRDLATSLSLTTGRKEAVFTLVPGTQDYPFSVIASDIKVVENVVRQGASDGQFGCDCGGGCFSCRGLCHDRFLSCDVDDVIAGIRLANHASGYDWYTIGTTLRLVPVPVSAEKCAIEYQSTGTSLADLPDVTSPGLVYAAVVAILDGTMNRVMSDRLTGKTVSEQGGNPVVSQERLNLISKQRDYYNGLYERECLRLARN